MRHTMPIAGFENRQTLRHPNCAVRIGQVDHPAPPLVDQANSTRRKDETNRAGVEQQEIVPYLQEVGAFGVRTKPSRRQNSARATQAAVPKSGPSFPADRTLATRASALERPARVRRVPRAERSASSGARDKVRCSREPRRRAPATSAWLRGLAALPRNCTVLAHSFSDVRTVSHLGRVDGFSQV